MNTLLLFFKRTTRQMQEWLDRHETVRRWLNILRLGLFQFGMGLSLAPLTGTLNRVLIDEMGISALAVGFLARHSLLCFPRAGYDRLSI